jgi:hypothetical protein
MTFVLQLYPVEERYCLPARPSLDNADGLIHWIDTQQQVQELLNISESIGYGIWRDVFNDFYIVARYDLNWAEVLNRPSLDVLTHTPTPSDWRKYHQKIREYLAMDLSCTLRYKVRPSSLSYRIRKKGKDFNLYKVFLV